MDGRRSQKQNFGHAFVQVNFSATADAAIYRERLLRKADFFLTVFMGTLLRPVFILITGLLKYFVIFGYLIGPIIIFIILFILIKSTVIYRRENSFRFFWTVSAVSMVFVKYMDFIKSDYYL